MGDDRTLRKTYRIKFVDWKFVIVLEVYSLATRPQLQSILKIEIYE